MADKKHVDDGGPAFPIQERQDDRFFGGYGMSLRDWFAGQAVGDLSAALNTVEGSKMLTRACHLHDGTPAEVIAMTAYQIADAMIAERYKVRT